MEYESVASIWPNVDANKEHQSLSDWFHAYLEAYRDDGVDITAETFPSEPGGGIFGLIVFLVLFGGIVVLAIVGLDSLFNLWP